VLVKRVYTVTQDFDRDGQHFVKGDLVEAWSDTAQKLIDEGLLAYRHYCPTCGQLVPSDIEEGE